MSVNIAITLFEEKSISQESVHKPSDCTFWTGRDGQMCVQYFRSKSDVFYPLHAHAEYVVVVCLAGEIEVKQLGQELTVGPGEAFIGNHGVFHSSSYRRRNGQSCEAVSISVDRRLMEVLTADFENLAWREAACPAFIGKAQGAVLQECALGIAQELKGSRQGHKVLIETQAIRLLIETMRHWPRFGIAEVKIDPSQRLPRNEFVRAYEFMRWCRKENFRLQFLCRFLGSSEERFTRLFQSSTQQTPASFYNNLLLDRACGLLAKPALSIKEIAFELGFKSSSHFIAAFRRKYAVSPQKYREQLSREEMSQVSRIALSPEFCSNVGMSRATVCK